MAGHSRPKDGVLSHAYVPAIHVLRSCITVRRGWFGSRACPNSACLCRKSGRPDLRRQARAWRRAI